MVSSTRQNDFDFIKGCLILFVIWGHFCMYLSGPGYEKNLCTTYIRLFQMPLFLFISGYFQKPVLSLSILVNKLKKSLYHIALPMISWIVLVYLTKLMLNTSSYDGFSYFIENAHGVVSLFWYLGCLLISIFIYSLISLFYNYNKTIGIIFFFVIMLATITIKSSIFYFPFLWLFFCMGVIYKRYSNSLSFISNSMYESWILICMIVIVLFIGGGYKTAWTFYNLDNSILTNDSGFDSEIIFIIFRYFAYGISTICSFTLLRKLYGFMSKTRIADIVVALGKETLFLYVAHVAIISLFANRIMRHVGYNDTILPYSPTLRYYIVCTLFTVLMAAFLYYCAHWIKKHSKIASKLFLGN